MLPGSKITGALRERFEQSGQRKTNRIMGTYQLIEDTSCNLALSSTATYSTVFAVM